MCVFVWFYRGMARCSLHNMRKNSTKILRSQVDDRDQQFFFFLSAFFKRVYLFGKTDRFFAMFSGTGNHQIFQAISQIYQPESTPFRSKFAARSKSPKKKGEQMHPSETEGSSRKKTTAPNFLKGEASSPPPS